MKATNAKLSPLLPMNFDDLSEDGKSAIFLIDDLIRVKMINVEVAKIGRKIIDIDEKIKQVQRSQMKKVVKEKEISELEQQQSDCKDQLIKYLDGDFSVSVEEISGRTGKQYTIVLDKPDENYECNNILVLVKTSHEDQYFPRNTRFFSARIHQGDSPKIHLILVREGRHIDNIYDLWIPAPIRIQVDSEGKIERFQYQPPLSKKQLEELTKGKFPQPVPPVTSTPESLAEKPKEEEKDKNGGNGDGNGDTDNNHEDPEEEARQEQIESAPPKILDSKENKKRGKKGGKRTRS